MRNKHRSFSEKFKLEAVRLVIEGDGSIAWIARDLGVQASILGSWKHDEQDKGSACPSKGQLKPPALYQPKS